MTARASLWLYFSCAVPAVAMLIANSAGAAELTIQPALQTSVTFADNIALAGYADEEKEVVLTVSPSVIAQGEGSRGNVNVRYDMDSLYYFNNPSSNNVRHRFIGTADAVLAENLAFVEGSGWVRRQSVDAGSNVGLNDPSVTAGAGQVSTWTLSPFVQYYFSGSSMVRAAVVFDYLDNPFERNDSYGREYVVSASNGTRVAKLNWNTTARAKSIYVNGGAPDYSTIEYRLSARYQWVSSWALVGSAGHLAYDYPNDPAIARLPGGNVWRAGISWTPTPRTDTEIGIGEHLFGRLHYGKVVHKARQYFLEFGVDEEVTTNRDVQIQENPVLDVNTGEPTGGIVQIRTESEEIFVNERSRFIIGNISPKVELNLQFHNDHRSFKTGVGDEIVYGGSFSWRWIVSVRTAWAFQYNERTIRSTTNDVAAYDDVLRNSKFGYEQKLSPRTVISADIQRVARNHEDSSVTDYIAHIFSVRARMIF